MCSGSNLIFFDFNLTLLRLNPTSLSSHSFSKAVAEYKKKVAQVRKFLNRWVVKSESAGYSSCHCHVFTAFAFKGRCGQHR